MKTIFQQICLIAVLVLPIMSFAQSQSPVAITLPPELTTNQVIRAKVLMCVCAAMTIAEKESFGRHQYYPGNPSLAHNFSYLKNMAMIQEIEVGPADNRSTITKRHLGFGDESDCQRAIRSNPVCPADSRY